MQVKNCPKCQKNYFQQTRVHYSKEGTCLAHFSVVKVTEKMVKFKDDTHVCLRCFKILDNQNAWDNHRKKIRIACEGLNNLLLNNITPQKNESNIDDRHENLELTNSLSFAKITGEKSTFANNTVSQYKQNPSDSRRTLFNTNLFSQSLKTEQRVIVSKELTNEEETSLLLLDNLASRCKMHLIQWVKKYHKIKRQYLQLFFQKFTDRLIKKLQEQIKTPTFESLQSQLKFNWRKIITDPTDIFDQQEIIKSVKDLPPTTRMKLLRCLNSIYEKDYSSIFPKYVIDYKPQTSRQHLPLKTVDLFEVLEQLFRTKQRTLVHIAIDFFLIFQSGQRFKSDRENIEQAVKQLLILRKKQQKLCQIEMKINKTARFNKNKKTKFIICQQLCQLLQHFGWTHFYKKGILYERMNSIFGFSIYSLKKCLFSEIYYKGEQLLRPNLKKLAAHKSDKTAMIYAAAGEDARIKILKDNLKIPNLVVQTIRRQQLHKQLLAKFPSGQRYAQVNKDWLQNLKTTLGNYNNQEVDLYDWSSSDFAAAAQFQNVDGEYLVDGAVPGKMQPQSQEDQKMEQSAEPQVKEVVYIYQQPYKLLNGKFDLRQAFIQQEINYCFTCEISAQNEIVAQFCQNGMKCKYCFANYHSKCIPKFCSCLSIQIDTKNGIHYTNNDTQKDCDIDIKMPQQYFTKNAENLQQIKFLLNARRFYYTATAVRLPEANFQLASNNIQSYKLIKLHLPNFQLYQNEQYFPPLQLKISGNQTVSGKGFGLFASEQIAKHCFIGEYAADILTDQQSILIRRPDSVMTLVPGNRRTNNIVVGPVKNCGYVCLINGSSESEANCKIITAEVNGFIRLILYSIKVIKKGTELCYNYSQISMYTKKSLTSYKNDNKQIVQMGTKSKLNKCGLVNLGSNCYMNAVFQLLRITLYSQFVEQQEYPVNKVFSELMKKMDTNKTYYPDMQAKFIQQFSKQQFKIGRQQDAQEFLTFIFDQFGNKMRKVYSGDIITSTQCQQCLQISKISDEFLNYIIDLSNQTKNTLFDKKYEELADYECSNCNKKVLAKKQETVERLPNVLFVCLKRFNNLLQKDQGLFDNFSFEKYGYKLTGIISHIGKQIQRGHYVTHQICENRKMFTYDDHRIKQGKYKYEEAYILGYIKL